MPDDATPSVQTRAAMEEAKQMISDVEVLPAFTPPARQRWESIPADIRQRLLANVWCGQCRREVSIPNFSGVMKGNHLLLVGRCAECQGDVARLVEGA